MDHDRRTTSCNSCRAVVTRTYRELRELGTEDPSAFKSAVSVLALRHPGRARQEYIAAVSDWLVDEP
jgi:hypothetical protein